ncbi:hypothetical protein GQ600_19987 [Phytophthora cactorum]|nr:hypothetical protein GQ600_19987 [Phytophthora cactorum]
MGAGVAVDGERHDCRSQHGLRGLAQRCKQCFLRAARQTSQQSDIFVARPSSVSWIKPSLLKTSRRVLSSSVDTTAVVCGRWQIPASTGWRSSIRAYRSQNGDKCLQRHEARNSVGRVVICDDIFLERLHIYKRSVLEYNCGVDFGVVEVVTVVVTLHVVRQRVVRVEELDALLERRDRERLASNLSDPVEGTTCPWPRRIGTLKGDDVFVSTRPPARTPSDRQLVRGRQIFQSQTVIDRLTSKLQHESGHRGLVQRELGQVSVDPLDALSIGWNRLYRCRRCCRHRHSPGDSTVSVSSLSTPSSRMKKVGTRISHAVAAGWRFLMSQFFHSNDRMNVHDVRRCARFR